MSVFTRHQRVTAVALAITLSAPLSAFAETRRLSQTDIAAIAAQVLQAILSRPVAQQSPQPRPAEKPRQDRRSAPQRTPESVPQASGISRESVLRAMNREREERGLRPLRLDRRLNAAANDRVQDMFDKHYFDHVSPDGTQPFVWVTYRDYQYATVGENLAEGQRSANQVVDAWMRSPGHRRNLLGSSFDDAGIAVVRGSPSGRTNGYTFVALYAREAGRQPSALMARR